MVRGSSARTAALALALAGAVCMLVAVVGSSSRDGAPTELWRDATPPVAPEPVALTPGLSAAVRDAGAERRAPLASETSDGLPVLRRERLRELAGLLRDPELRHVVWDRQLAAAARDFEPAESPALAAIVASSAASREERIAAAELLRACLERAPAAAGPAHPVAPVNSVNPASALEPAALEFLRRAAPPDGKHLLACAAAARALAEFGDDADRARLIERLGDASSEIALSTAWALSGSPRPDVARELARRVAHSEAAITGGPNSVPRDGELASAAAVLALGGMLARVNGPERLAGSQDAIAEELAGVFEAAGRAQIAIRAAGVLGALGGERSTQVLEQALQRGTDDTDVVRALARALLERPAGNPGTETSSVAGSGARSAWERHTGRARFELACATAELPMHRELDDDSRGRLSEELCATLGSGGTPASRRRALRALARLGTAEGRAWIERLSLGDPDAATRAAAREELETAAPVEGFAEARGIRGRE